MTEIVAPVAGWLAAIEDVSDPVFASGSMGPGFAIDPVEGLVTAPCDGIVAAIAPTGHSVTIEAAGGATILIHVGLDTVALKGEGFEMLVAEGAGVAAGEPLIRFDMDRVALGARSLMTPVLVIGEGDRIDISGLGRAVSRGEIIARAEGNAAPARAVSAEVVRTVIVPMPNGIHARPAARIVEALKPYNAEIALTLADRRASARSVVGLLKLAAKQGDRLGIAASGPDAGAAANALAALIESGMGETEAAPLVTATALESAGPVLKGVAAAPGLAIGVACHFGRTEIDVPELGQGIARERAALADAIGKVASELHSNTRGPAADIARAHLALLDDPELREAADEQMATGRSAAFAWRSAIRESAAALKATGDALLMERVADLTDLERQVVSLLVGSDAAAQTLPQNAILIADDLLPSEFQALDPERLAGIALSAGGPTSHVAVLAASAGVPMLVALGPAVHGVADGAPLILDAANATLDTAPDPQALDDAARRLADQREARAAARKQAADEARTSDGARIEVFANLGSVEDAGRAVAEGAEGCGLLRTEFLFFGREAAPDGNEQARIYAAIAAALGERPLIVRTFDIGGDKPVPYLPMAAEENPALGLRGVRLNLLRADLLDTQLRAILRGVPSAQRRIMVPMVIEAAELRQVRERLRAAEAALGIAEPTPLGVMIETPAAALLAGTIAAEADFLSIGSNDLTQYALACDRGNPATAARVDALHPAVLHLIAAASSGAAKHGRWLGVCGGIASDADATPLLIGLGATELSVAPAQVAAIKAHVRALDIGACRTLAQQALACADAAEVRALLAEAGR
ncbi:MAG: phosphoenolpyruvate--protein phosphotransferase [Proteobacteria bacterium]|nr:phosphoenolpyruvate--protein phosphotransferase [Pseudomonadota bacterium]